MLISQYYLYADDLQLYQHFSFKDVEEATHLLNNDLNRVNTWTSGQSFLASLSIRLKLSKLPVALYDNIRNLYPDTAKN